MANMDYTPVKFMIKVFEANYPESLGRVCVHHSPWIFHSIWSIIKGWLDPVVAAKVHFTKDVKELEAFVAPEHIPKEMGGKEDWEYRYVEPVFEENRNLDEAKQGNEDYRRIQSERAGLVEEYEKETLTWCRGNGFTDASTRRRAVSKQLVANYWKLDPFIRAKTLYDRTGVIRRGGDIDFYPKTVQHSADDVD